jgi:hypothetical protein
MKRIQINHQYKFLKHACTILEPRVVHGAHMIAMYTQSRDYDLEATNLS